ncbi:methionine aminopeptidase [Litchfieldia alkalitelluris]|uniref:methionine aminopeptidase n=1 Tax=Litchfieldia alkalitelluris TaxID=304268 RepID=UPI0009986EAC|nr:methionine aminopeptidase [Litchfieldia alkalitelluris]
MGLIDTLNDWLTSRNERRLEQMESLGLCPDCNGRGFHTFNSYEFYYSNPIDCIGCNGSGTFSDWFDENQ